MRNFLLVIIMAFLINVIANAQTANINDIKNQQNIINACNQMISGCATNTATCQANITAANNAIALDNAAIAAYNADNAQNASGVNWDYFVTLEPQIPFSTWSKVNNGVNWTAIVPTLGINCGGITESGVNWSNWGNCEANGMTPGKPYGGYNTGIAAFWCGNGKITGTC